MRRTKIFLGIGALLILALLILSFSLVWAIRNFGNISLNEIVFTLNMPLEGASDSFTLGYFKKALLPAIALWLIAVGIAGRAFRRGRGGARLGKRVPAGVLLFCLAWGSILFWQFDRHFDCVRYLKSNFQSSRLIEQKYVDPGKAKLDFPKKKRNLIYIYMESAESSLQDKGNGGLFDTNYIPEMTELEKQNISFSQTKAFKGAAVAPATGWTVAGMVAQSSGLPLKLFEYDERETDNSMGRYEKFMPGATMLGDLLEEQGYRNVFLCGSDVRFGGTDKFLKQHGHYELFDYVRAKKSGRIPQDYEVWWGMEDEKLYAWAKEELTELSKSDQPFNFTMATMDTHHVGGYLSPNAPTPYGDQYANVWAFSSTQVNEFVEWIKQQDFYENTTIVICGDHCSMDPNFFADFKYDKHRGETVRAVYNVYINSAVDKRKAKIHDRKFTTMDFFPTTVAALGIRIEGDRLGIGTNLFSEKMTLSEELGYRKFFAELNKKSSFYNSEILYGK